jgi:hypothetical protein
MLQGITKFDDFLNFVYESPPLTPKESFIESNKEQYQGGPSGEPPKL